MDGLHILLLIAFLPIQTSFINSGILVQCILDVVHFKFAAHYKCTIYYVCSVNEYKCKLTP